MIATIVAISARVTIGVGHLFGMGEHGAESGMGGLEIRGMIGLPFPENQA